MKGDFALETMTTEPYVGMPVYLDDTFFEYEETVETAGHHLADSCYPQCNLKPDWDKKPETNVKPDMNMKPDMNVRPDMNMKPESGKTDCVKGCPLAMAYVPWQSFEKTYSLEEGFKAGTVFPCLDLPFMGGAKK